jgi:hypothetical protein
MKGQVHLEDISEPRHSEDTPESGGHLALLLLKTKKGAVPVYDELLASYYWGKR